MAAPGTHRNVASVVAAAEALGLALTIRSFPDGTRTAAGAAAAVTHLPPQRARTRSDHIPGPGSAS